MASMRLGLCCSYWQAREALHAADTLVFVFSTAARTFRAIFAKGKGTNNSRSFTSEQTVAGPDLCFFFCLFEKRTRANLALPSAEVGTGLNRSKR
jgi:hypothetical protein